MTLPLVVTRLLLLEIGLIALSRITNVPNPWTATPHPWINIWSRWDAGWYLGIAQRGYGHEFRGQPDYAFFPVYPYLMRAIAAAVGESNSTGWLLSGIVISNVSLLIGLVYLVYLLRLDVDDAIAARAALQVLVFPTTLFLSAVYPMSLMMALVVAAFYCARRSQWWVTGMLSAAAAAARPEGVLTVIPLFFEGLYQRRSRQGPFPWQMAALILGPIAFIGWGAYIYSLTGDPLTIVKVQSAWGRHLVVPWEFVGQTARSSFMILFFVTVVAAWRLVRPSYALFATLQFLLLLSAGGLGPAMRLVLPLFPMFLVWAVAGRSDRFHLAWIVFSTAIAALNMVLFATWHEPVGGI